MCQICTIELLTNPINNTVNDGSVSPRRFPGIRGSTAPLENTRWLCWEQYLVSGDQLPPVIRPQATRSEWRFVRQREPAGGRFRHLLQRPWRFSRFVQLGINPTVDQESTGGLDGMSHLSRDDKWPSGSPQVACFWRKSSFFCR